jgi:hypothetical protein
MAVFKNPNFPAQPEAGVYGWFAEKNGEIQFAIYIGMAGRKNSFTQKGTLFRGVSELQRNTFTSNSPGYDALDIDFIIGTAIKFFELKGYTCLWEHLDDDPTKKLEIVKSMKPIIQKIENAKILDELRIRKIEKHYWKHRQNIKGVNEAESEVFSVLQRLI